MPCQCHFEMGHCCSSTISSSVLDVIKLIETRNVNYEPGQLSFTVSDSVTQLRYLNSLSHAISRHCFLGADGPQINNLPNTFSELPTSKFTHVRLERNSPEFMTPPSLTALSLGIGCSPRAPEGAGPGLSLWRCSSGCVQLPGTQPPPARSFEPLSTTIGLENMEQI